MAEIKMDYQMMAEMKDTFQKSAEELDDTLHQMEKVAEMLEGGGLIGEGGSAFTDAVRNALNPKIKELMQKFEEIQRDIGNAVEAMQQSDTTSSSEMGL